MINLTKSGTRIIFNSSVGGFIDSELIGAEKVDETSYHIQTEAGVFLINVTDSTINSVQFNTPDKAIDYLI